MRARVRGRSVDRERGREGECGSSGGRETEVLKEREVGRGSVIL